MKVKAVWPARTVTSSKDRWPKHSGEIADHIMIRRRTVISTYYIALDNFKISVTTSKEIKNCVQDVH
jgi:hypothetical protein